MLHQQLFNVFAQGRVHTELSDLTTEQKLTARLTVHSITVHSKGIYIPLTNRVRGPYRKLRTEFFPFLFMTELSDLTTEQKLTARLTAHSITVHSKGIYIPLTNRVRGPYRKLRTEFFPFLFMAQVLRAWAINRKGKNKDP